VLPPTVADKEEPLIVESDSKEKEIVEVPQKKVEVEIVTE
jgi:hypothetical protein